MGKKSETLRWFSLPLLMVFIFIGLGEIATRGLGLVDRANGFPRKLFAPSDNPALGYEMRQNLKAMVRGVSVRTNALGFRGPEVTLPKPEGIRRVLLLGDSVTFGYRMAEPMIFPTLLREHLQLRPNEHWDIVNLGVEGYNTAAQEIVLQQVGLALQPDVVILAFNLNDYDTMPAVGPRGVLTLNPEGTRSPWSPAHIPEFYLLLEWIGKTGGRIWFGGPTAEPNADDAPFEDLDIYVSALRKAYWRNPTDQRLAHVQTSLRQMQARLQQRGIPFLVVILPDGDQVGVSTPDLSPQQRMAIICHAENLRCLDLLPAFVAEPQKRLFMDIMHPNPAGHRIIAREIAQQLVAP